MKTHVIREHGAVFQNRYCVVNQLPVGSKKRGQTVCSFCSAEHNNHSRPNICSCGHSLVKVKTPPQLSAVRLFGEIFSVRKHLHGLAKRVIVDCSSQKCFNEDCLESRLHFKNATKFKCVHLDACGRNCENAIVKHVKLTTISKYISGIVAELQCFAVDGKLIVYFLPDNNVALSCLKPNSHDCRSGFIHIDLKNIKCPLRKCKQNTKSHCLVKSESNCIHTLLCKLIRGEGDPQKNLAEKSRETVSHHFSKQKTAQHLTEKIICCIPSPLEMEKENLFLQNSLDFQVSVFKSRDISSCDS